MKLQETYSQIGRWRTPLSPSFFSKLVHHLSSSVYFSFSKLTLTQDDWCPPFWGPFLLLSCGSRNTLGLELHHNRATWIETTGLKQKWTPKWGWHYIPSCGYRKHVTCQCELGCGKPRFEVEGCKGGENCGCFSSGKPLFMDDTTASSIPLLCTAFSLLYPQGILRFPFISSQRELPIWSKQINS